MANYKTFPAQLNALKKAINQKTEEANSNINYKLDYVKFLVHPNLSNILILKHRLHGISGGQPFDEIDYIFFDENGKKVDIRKSFVEVNAWYTFVSEMREAKIINGHIELI